MAKIEYRVMNDGPVEECRILCNELMKLQAERAHSYKDILGAMNFENRLKPSFENAKERFLLVAYDNDLAIGYVFASTEWVYEAADQAKPEWAMGFPKGSKWIYPEDIPLPFKIGELVNLNIKPEYRGLHIGEHLMDKAMKWLRTRENVDRLMVYVSNGNNPGTFYERYGFKHSFSVLDGMIEAYAQE